MSRFPARLIVLPILIGSALLLQGCLVGAVVGTAGAVVGGAAKVTGAVVGAGVDAVTTSDEETRLKRERDSTERNRWPDALASCSPDPRPGLAARARVTEFAPERNLNVRQAAPVPPWVASPARCLTSPTRCRADF